MGWGLIVLIIFFVGIFEKRITWKLWIFLFIFTLYIMMISLNSIVDLIG